jgi:hypothetical protein
MAEQALDEGARAGVLLHEQAVLGAELVGLGGLCVYLALELADVLCAVLASTSDR